MLQGFDGRDVYQSIAGEGKRTLEIPEMMRTRRTKLLMHEVQQGNIYSISMCNQMVTSETRE